MTFIDGSRVKLAQSMPKSGEINDYYDKITNVLDTLNDRIKTVVDTNQDVFIEGTFLARDNMKLIISYYSIQRLNG